MPGRRTLPPVCHPSALVAQQHPAAPSTAAGSLSTAAPVTNLTTVPPDGALIAQSSAGATHAADGERHVALSPNQGRDNQPLPRLSYLASPYRYRVHSIAAPRHHTVLPYARHQQHVEQADPQRGATVSTIGPIRTTPGTRHAGSASRIESTAGRVAPSAPRPVLLFAPVAGAQMLRRQLENRLYRIPLAPLRTDNCFARYPVRFPDGQVGINVSAFVNLATYTKAGLAHPEAERAVGARADLDGLIKGTRILCTSSAVPADVYEREKVLQECFPESITTFVDVREVDKSPAEGFTFAHLLTTIASRQAKWCYNMIYYDKTITQRRGVIDLLRHVLYIVAIRGGVDRQGRQVWYPELEFRIPEERLPRSS